MRPPSTIPGKRCPSARLLGGPGEASPLPSRAPLRGFPTHTVQRPPHSRSVPGGETGRVSVGESEPRSRLGSARAGGRGDRPGRRFLEVRPHPAVDPHTQCREARSPMRWHRCNARAQRNSGIVRVGRAGQDPRRGLHPQSLERSGVRSRAPTPLSGSRVVGTENSACIPPHFPFSPGLLSMATSRISERPSLKGFWHQEWLSK